MTARSPGEAPRRRGSGASVSGQPRQTAPGRDAQSQVARLHRLVPAGAVGGQVLAGDQAVPLGHQGEEGLRERAVVERPAALLGEHLERAGEVGLDEQVAGLEQRPVRHEDLRSLAHRHDGREHREAERVRPRHGDAVARDADGGLDQARPGQPAVAAPELVEPRGDARDGARADSHRVVDDLDPERHREALELRLGGRAAEAGDGDEEVQVRRRAGLPVDPQAVPAAREAGHDDLGGARGERGGDRGVGGGSALLEDLQTGARGRRVIRRDPGLQAAHGRSIRQDARSRC